jgi:hypothetical protein
MFQSKYLSDWSPSNLAYKFIYFNLPNETVNLEPKRWEFNRIYDHGRSDTSVKIKSKENQVVWKGGGTIMNLTHPLLPKYSWMTWNGDLSRQIWLKKEASLMQRLKFHVRIEQYSSFHHRDTRAGVQGRSYKSLRCRRKIAFLHQTSACTPCTKGNVELWVYPGRGCWCALFITAYPSP